MVDMLYYNNESIINAQIRLEANYIFSAYIYWMCESFIDMIRNKKIPTKLYLQPDALWNVLYI